MKTRLIVQIVGAFLKIISPILRNQLDTIIKQLYQKALTTDNAMDDIFVESLADFLEIDLEGVEAPKK